MLQRHLHAAEARRVALSLFQARLAIPQAEAKEETGCPMEKTPPPPTTPSGTVEDARWSSKNVRTISHHATAMFGRNRTKNAVVAMFFFSE